MGLRHRLTILLSALAIVLFCAPALSLELPGVPLRVQNPDDATSADLDSLHRGARALPPELLVFLEEPLTITFKDQPCLGSLGRYNDTCPTFGDTPYELFIYRSVPYPGDHPASAINALPNEERRDLELRRAIAHAIMFHVEQSLGWSALPEWRSINGWVRRRPNALNIDPHGFARELGMRSPSLDLLTYAEEFFAPVDVQAAACRYMAQRRFFDARLAELQPDRPAYQPPPCPEFDQWARPDQVQGIDLLLASATDARPESLYGHLLLHVRYRQDASRQGPISGPGFEPVYQFGALTDTDVSPTTFFSRGLLGGFPSNLEFTTFRTAERHFLQYQQRNLLPFTLLLSDTETRQILERIWDAERRVLYPYAFFANNCASFLLDLLSPVLDPTLIDRRRGIALPTDILDLLSHRLQRQPTHLSTGEVASRAALSRRQHLLDLLPHLSEADARRLEALHQDLSTPDPEARRDALIALPDLLIVALRDRPDLHHAALSFAYDSLLIERHLTELANLTRRLMLFNIHSEDTPEVPLTIADQLAIRRSLFADEDLERRATELNHLARGIESRIDGPLPRDLTPDEEDLLAMEARIAAAYQAALTTQAALLDAFEATITGPRFIADRRTTLSEEALQHDRLSRRSSGRNRRTLGATSSLLGNEIRPGVHISFSAMEDRLGEHRSRGIGADLESRILGLDLDLPLAADGLRDLRFRITPFEYASMKTRVPPLSRGLRDRLGWSITTGLEHDGTRDLFAGAFVRPALLLPVVSPQARPHLLVLSTHLTLRHDVHAAHAPFLGAGVALRAQRHLGGHYANLLRLSAQATGLASVAFALPILDTDLTPFHFDAEIRQDVALRVTQFADRELIFAPFIQATWTTRDYRPDAPPLHIRVDLGVTLEF